MLSLLSFAAIFAALATAQSNSTLATAQNSTTSSGGAQTTAAFFIPGGYEGVGWVGSVVGACSGSTTFAMHCTDDGFVEQMQAACTPGADAYTYTEGPSFYMATVSTVVQGATGIVSESCSIAPGTSASCTISVSASASGTSYKTADSNVISASDIRTYQVPITAGAEKLGATGACSSDSGKSGAVSGKTAAVGFGVLAAGSLMGMLLL